MASKGPRVVGYLLPNQVYTQLQPGQQAYNGQYDPVTLANYQWTIHQGVASVIYRGNQEQWLPAVLSFIWKCLHYLQWRGILAVAHITL